MPITRINTDVTNISDLSLSIATDNITNGVKFIIDNKQDQLVSGTNIKSINGSSILGSGNVTIQTSSGFEQQFLLMGA